MKAILYPSVNNAAAAAPTSPSVMGRELTEAVTEMLIHFFFIPLPSRAPTV